MTALLALSTVPADWAAAATFVAVVVWLAWPRHQDPTDAHRARMDALGQALHHTPNPATVRPGRPRPYPYPKESTTDGQT